MEEEEGKLPSDDVRASPGLGRGEGGREEGEKGEVIALRGMRRERARGKNEKI